MDGLPLQPGSNWIRRDDYHGFSSFSTAWYISYSMKWYIRFSIIIGSFFYQSPFSGRLPCYVRVRGNRTTNQSNALISRYNYVFINCHSWKQFDHLDPLKTGYFTTHVSTLLPSLKKKHGPSTGCEIPPSARARTRRTSTIQNYLVGAKSHSIESPTNQYIPIVYTT